MDWFAGFVSNKKLQGLRTTPMPISLSDGREIHCTLLIYLNGLDREEIKGKFVSMAVLLESGQETLADENFVVTTFIMNTSSAGAFMKAVKVKGSQSTGLANFIENTEFAKFVNSAGSVKFGVSVRHFSDLKRTLN